MSDETTVGAGWTEEVRQALLRPFPADVIGFLPRAIKDGRALALPHVDARDVMTRLDNVIGPEDWHFTYDVVPSNGPRVMVKGRLIVYGAIREDAGEAQKEDEPLKSAVSDALKRCAVHFGIARYLYYLDPIWSAYDAGRNRFSERPQLNTQAVAQAARKAGWKGTVPGEDPARVVITQSERPDLVVPEPEEDETPAPSRPATPAAGNGDGVTCEDCGVKLTKGQNDLSLRAFSRSLCPRHQKEAAGK